MKSSLLALFAVLFLVGCAGSRVVRTEVATGAANPKAIYIRPFTVEHGIYRDRFDPNGEPIRRSQAPRFFADVLAEELSKIAPTRVLEDDEFARTGWLVEGALEVVSAGSPSEVIAHVRVTDLCKNDVVEAGKEGVSPYRAARSRYGKVIYEFDIKGGSRGTGPFGSITAPGFGPAVPFDFRNAAERIYLVLTPDAFRYGYRNSPAQRR